VRLIAVFPLVFLFWYAAAPVMNATVAFIAEPVVNILDWHDLTQDIKTEGSRFVLYFSPSDGKPVIGEYRRISYNFVFLVALILAVPDIRPRLRLKILVMGLLILYPLQVFRIVVFILNHYGQHMISGEQTLYPFLYRKSLFYIYRIQLVLDGYLTPIVIWAGLYLYYKWSSEYLMRRKTA
jgi:hypothetical protein